MRLGPGRIARRLGSAEAGLTVVEVVVAGMILVVGGVGVLGMVDASSRNSFRAEQRQVVNNVLQREMEAIKALPYEEVGLNSMPAEGSGENDPSSRVAGESFDLDRGPAEDLEPIVSGGSVSSGPESLQVEDVGFQVYRYVVWDECPEEGPEDVCGEDELLKRLVVAVRLDSTAAGGSERRYQELQGQIVDPEAEPEENEGPAPGGGEGAWWRLWLTDTSCDQPERKEHPEEEGNHATNNTLGDCADGQQQGENAPGAPDLLWPEDLESAKGYKYDYATDVNPQPDEDEGLQIMPSGSCESLDMLELARGVATGPDPDEHAFRKVHRWLTPPLPPTEEPGEGLTLTGEGTLSLWMRIVGETSYPGTICAWLFVRTYGEGTVTDTLMINSGPPLSLYFDHFEQTWPGLWGDVTLPLSFEDKDGAQVTLPPGSRVGLALSVAGDTETGLQFLYDQPSFDSQLWLQTTGVLPKAPGEEA